MPSNGNKLVVEINNSLNNKDKPEYKPINILIDKEDEKYYYSFLLKIDLNFCKEYSIGPYFLKSIPILFDVEYSNNERNVLKELYIKTNYKSYQKRSKLDYKLFFSSNSLINIKSIYNINECILYCPSTTFRIPLYCYKFYNIDKSNVYYNNEHEDIEDTKSKSQIELDLFRTSTKYPVLKQKNFINNFRSLLYEVSIRDKELGYVQGMNFIGAFILMLTGNQLELSLIYFLKILNLKSDYFNMCFRYCYCENFTLLNNYIILFKDITFRYENDIYNRLEEMEDIGYYWITKWIQTLFVLNFRYEMAMKFWDIILSQGVDSIIPISLSIITYYKKKVLSSKCDEDFINIVQRFNNIDDTESTKLFTYVLNDIVNNKYKL